MIFIMTPIRRQNSLRFLPLVGAASPFPNPCSRRQVGQASVLSLQV